MAATEIKGIFQSDIIIRTAIIRALELMRANPSLLDAVFHSLVEDELTRNVYGEKQIELSKEWFLKTEIPVMMNFRVSESDIPCIVISLQESVEAEQTHGDVHYVPQETTDGDWPPLSPPFTPLAYSPTSGIMLLPANLMGDQLIAPGMLVVTRDGRQYPIVANLGDDEISLAPYTTGDFTGAIIRGATQRYVTTVESVDFKESYQIGIHVMNEPVNLLVLHSIVKFCLLKYKQELLEARGFERSVLSSTDLRRNMEFDMEEAFVRFINITGYVRQYWPKDTKPMIDVVNSSFIIDPLSIVVSEVGGEEGDPVDEEGHPPGPDDLWTVIPNQNPETD